MDNTKSVEKSHEQVQLRSLGKNTVKGNSMEQKLSFADNSPVTQRQRDMMGVIQRAHYKPEMSRYPKLSPKTVVNWDTETIEDTEVGVKMDAYLAVDHIQGNQPKDKALEPLFPRLPHIGKSADQYYIRGHLLNDNLGGPGEGYNLFPITQDANIKHENCIEKIVKNWVNDEKQYVHYTVMVYPEKLEQYKETIQNEDEELITPFINSRFSCVAELLNVKSDAPKNKISADIYSNYREKTTPELDKKQYDSKILFSKTHELVNPVLSYGKDPLKHFNACTPSDKAWLKRQIQKRNWLLIKDKIEQINIFFYTKISMELLNIYSLFEKPVNPIEENCPDYLSIIKTPMDMTQIYKKMTTDHYKTVGDMIDDINTCLTNYKTYHPANDPYISSIDKILALPFLAWKLRQVGS